MKKSSFWISAAAALVLAVVLAGCGQTYYFAGRSLPPSGISNRVMVAIQNPGSLSKGALQILDAYYDTRYKYNNLSVTFSISGFSGALPSTIQNMPEEQVGAVYGSGDGTLTYVDYQKETTSGTQSNLPSNSSSVFVTRDRVYAFAVSQSSHALTIVDGSGTLAGTYTLSLPGAYRVSINPGGSVALVFAQNSDYLYYPKKLSSSQSQNYSGGPSNWPKAAVDCEPQNKPGWCLFQAQSPDSTDATGTPYGAPLKFNRPTKALFSNDGSTAYVLSCGVECGGTASSVSLLPTAGMIYLQNQGSGLLPSTTDLAKNCSSAANLSTCTISVPGGASNALIDSTTMYVIGQCLASSSTSGDPQCAGSGASSGLFTGSLTVLNLAPGSGATVTAGNRQSISDGLPMGPTRMLEADDNTLWIATTKCTNGARYANGLSYGCMTVYDTSAGAVKSILPYLGDATGVAAVTGLHKVYTAIGGQVHIYATDSLSELNNQYVTVTGTAYDVAYMDGLSDANNTVY